MTRGACGTDTILRHQDIFEMRVKAFEFSYFYVHVPSEDQKLITMEVKSNSSVNVYSNNVVVCPNLNTVPFMFTGGGDTWFKGVSNYRVGNETTLAIGIYSNVDQTVKVKLPGAKEISARVIIIVKLLLLLFGMLAVSLSFFCYCVLKQQPKVQKVD